MVALKSALLFLAAAQAADAVQLLELLPNVSRGQLLKQLQSVKGIFPTDSSSRIRKIEEADCTGTPFLWKIIENVSGNHVGFAFGTLHLPVDLVLTEDAIASVISAVEDSCNIYAELDLFDPQVILDVQICQEWCVEPLRDAAATVLDIQDDEVKAAYEAKLMDFAMEIVMSTGTLTADESAVDEIYQAFLSLPLPEIIGIIAISNTPEYIPHFLETLSGVTHSFLDLELLSLGRVPGGVEEVSTQCDLLKEPYLTQEEFNTQELLLALNRTLSDQINSYKCGNIDHYIDVVEKSWAFEDDEYIQHILDDRNEQMAAAIANILTTSEERALFVFGNDHWLIGDKSLNILLNDYGYSLEHVPTYGEDDAENLSDQECGVEYNAFWGLYELSDVTESVSTNAPSVSSIIGSSAPTTVDWAALVDFCFPPWMPSSSPVTESVSTSAPSAPVSTNAPSVPSIDGSFAPTIDWTALLGPPSADASSAPTIVGNEMSSSSPVTESVSTSAPSAPVSTNAPSVPSADASSAPTIDGTALLGPPSADASSAPIIIESEMPSTSPVTESVSTNSPSAPVSTNPPSVPSADASSAPTIDGTALLGPPSADASSAPIIIGSEIPSASPVLSEVNEDATVSISTILETFDSSEPTIIGNEMPSASPVLAEGNEENDSNPGTLEYSVNMFTPTIATVLFVFCFFY